MPSTWNLLKRIGLKKVDELKDSFQTDRMERMDKDLPLGLRINALVDISEVDFILGGNDLKVAYPGETLTVSSFGVILVGESKVQRFYLSSAKGINVLQIVTDNNQAIEECKLFIPYDEVFPEDWDFWLSKEDGYIGYSVFQTKDGTAYERVWQDEGAERVVQEDDQGNKLTRIPPVPLYETIYLDPHGQRRETVRHESMLYARHVNDNVDEYLLVSAVEEKEGASVQIMAGLELQPASIKVI